MKLAIAQMVFGALIVVDFVSFGLFSAGEAAFPAGWWKVFYFHNFLAFFVLGLAVFGCGVAQFVRARRLSSLCNNEGAKEVHNI